MTGSRSPPRTPTAAAATSPHPAPKAQWQPRLCYWNLYRLRCPGCRARTTAWLPAAVAGSAFGSRLCAAIVTLTARHRISRRGIAELAGELFGARLSTGSVDAICQHASTALSVPQSALRAWILAQDALHVDETGWRTGGDSRALWTAATAGASLFEIAEQLQPRAVQPS